MGTFGFPAGSFGYTAPEILDGEMYDHRADLYSFGVLLWVLYTGGDTAKEEPSPPINHVDDDYEVLERFLRDPAAQGMEPLPDAAHSMVQALTHRSPELRIEHAGIREHPFMASVDLPQ